MRAVFTRADVENQRTIQLERRRFAERVDRALRRTEGQEALARAVLGETAAVFLRSRAQEHLGFVRRGDYCRERLGRSARHLQTAAQMIRRLGELPRTRAAFLRGDLSWTQARLLAAIATAADEGAWLARANGTTVRELRAVVRGHVAAGRGDAALSNDDDADDTLDGEPTLRVRLACPTRLRVLWRYTMELARRMVGENGPHWQAIEAIAAEGLSGASRVARRAAADCPTPWRHQGKVKASLDEVGSATRGMAAGGIDGGPAAAPGPAVGLPGDVAQAAPAEAMGGTSAAGIDTDASGPDTHALDEQLLRGNEAFDAACTDVAVLAEGLEALDPAALDARLRTIDRALRTGAARVGRLLALVAGLRLHRTLGFASLDAYVAERLTLSIRTARALITLDRACARAPAFAAAYRQGKLSWAQAQCLLPVLDRTTEAAWIARAGTVTVRRLKAEVAWALDRRDVFDPEADLMPPPADARLGPPGAAAREMANGIEVPKDVTPAADTVQECAVQTDARESGRGAAPWTAAVPQRGTEICDAEIDFVAPESVATLWRGALIAFSPPGAPRWEGLAGLLQHVVTEWERQPRLRDPIFARDGFLCTVPGCSGRRNLQDHHLLFRSRGGGNEQTNRTTVCAAHHLRAIHRGRVRAWGRAPEAIRWELGVTPHAPAFLRLLGDRYLEDDAAA